MTPTKNTFDTHVRDSYKEHIWHFFSSGADTKPTLKSLKSVSRAFGQIESKPFILDTLNQSRTLKSWNLTEECESCSYWAVKLKAIPLFLQRAKNIITLKWSEGMKIILGPMTSVAKRGWQSYVFQLIWCIAEYFDHDKVKRHIT